MELIEKKVEKEFHTCEKCGYDKGFHVSLVKNTGDFEIVFVCPQCGQRYRVGWKTGLV